MIKKILIVSDSHGKSKNVKQAIDREKPDMLIHLGDIEDDPELVREWLDDAAKRWNASHEETERKSLPIPAVFIQGNCDRYRMGNTSSDDGLKSAAVFEVNDHRFFCTHGHKQGVGFGVENLMYSAMENDCDIALFGHTHVPFDDYFEGYDSAACGVRILNPGSISLPRAGTRKSYIIMEFNGDEYEVMLKYL